MLGFKCTILLAIRNVVFILGLVLILLCTISDGALYRLAPPANRLISN
jgi:hypothetical protein